VKRYSSPRTGLRFVVPAAWFLIALLASPFVDDASAQSAPALPQSWVDTTLQAPTGRTIAVAAGGDFQAALNTAQPGDVITLQAGATFPGPFTLPNKSGSGWITVRSSAPDSALPAPGTRIDPSYSSAMPKVVVPQLVNDYPPALQTAAGAHHFRFIGVELTAAPSMYTYTLVQLGWYETVASDLPHDIIIDRCYIHADPTAGARRGVAMNGNSLALIDSYVSDFKEVGADSQGVFAFNGYGPLKIVNNYIEAAGENLLFGGATPRIANLLPADAEIRQNYFFKPYTWKQDDPSYSGVQYNVKNLLELKMGQRILVDGNIFEHSWPAAQQGWAVLFTPRTESGTAPWVVVQDVTFSNNAIRDVAMGFDISGVDGTDPTPRTARIAIRNNLFDGVNGSSYGPGHWLVFAAGMTDLAVEHNTVLHNGNITSVDGIPTTGFVFQNNLMPHNAYGVSSPKGVGDATLANYFPSAAFHKNAMAGPWPTAGGATVSMYSAHPDTFFPASLDTVGFVDLSGHNYRLSPSSPYKNAATDGKDLGVDYDLLTLAVTVSPAAPAAATTPTTSPTTSPTASPSPSPTPTPTPFVDHTAPSISILSPVNGSTISTTVTVISSASDNVGVAGTQLRIDGVVVAGYQPASYAMSWNPNTVAVGAHTLSVLAYDAVGNASTSSVTVNVVRADTTPPVVRITSPKNGGGVGKQTRISVTASDNSSVSNISVYGDGRLLGSYACGAASCNASAYWNTGALARGTHTISATARDASGNQATTAITVYR
jgi:hypothetical protein